MGLWSRLTGEFIDVIDWVDDSNDTIVHRFERKDNSIKYGAKLTVREGQVAVFVHEGRLADVFPPGMYKLETKNLPILTTLLSWAHGFESPFKAEVYFVSTRQFTDLKWGTKNPVMLRDPEFGPVRLRAYGTYAIRVVDPAKFLREIVGTDGWFTTDEISNQLRNFIVSRLGVALGKSNIPVLDLAANYDELGRYLMSRLEGETMGYGVELTTLLVENISLPTAVEEALDRRTSMGVIGDLSRYMQYQTAESIRIGAENPGGAAGAAIGAGMGVGLGAQVAGALAGPWGARGPAQVAAPAAAAPQIVAPAAPPPLPSKPPRFHVAREGAAAGPFALDVLFDQAALGEIDRATLVWTTGMAGWEPAGEVPALAELFDAVPPPLPAP